MHPRSGNVSRFPTLRITCVLAVVAMAVSSTYIWRGAQTGSGELPNFIALGTTLAAMVVAGVAGAGWAAKRRFRTGVGRAFWAVAGAATVVTVASLALHAWMYANPYGAYARQFGGAGACLTGTAYASDRAHLSLEDPSKKAKRDNDEWLRVVPAGGGKGSSLIFNIPSKGELTPVDDNTRQVISKSAC